uniref:Uncharacterized protein n=1 Tax=Sphaerodactylus townsendi TaxID=933632 RepID=A0ACB8FYM8_9SAUR
MYKIGRDKNEDCSPINFCKQLKKCFLKSIHNVHPTPPLHIYNFFSFLKKFHYNWFYNIDIRLLGLAWPECTSELKMLTIPDRGLNISSSNDSSALGTSTQASSPLEDTKSNASKLVMIMVQSRQTAGHVVKIISDPATSPSLPLKC